MSILSVTIGNMRRSRGVALQLAGIISDGGVRYSIYVSPKIGGESANPLGRTWSTQKLNAPAACQTLTNGLGSTNAMISAGTAVYTAAGFAQTARTNKVGGYNDWYIPARDELELCYRNLKPTTALNQPGLRPVGGYGGDGLDIGRNMNSDPANGTYTAKYPAQTTVTAYMSLDIEGFNANAYWSSTECFTDEAWVQSFGMGGQYTAAKNTASSCYRLVRRVAA